MTDQTTTPPDERRAAARTALTRLLEGNRRFASGVVPDTSVGPDRREELLEAQHPVAVVLGCVDARVPPEVILGQGVGDLLTVRTAGQSLHGVALGSIEFGARVLRVPLVVVLGHTGCGAVLAALTGDQPDGALGELIGEVAERLTSVVGGEDPIRATGGNLQATVDVLRRIGTLEAEDGPAYVVGMLYDMATGAVTVTDDAGLLEGAPT